MSRSRAWRGWLRFQHGNWKGARQTPATPPPPAELAFVYPHKRLMDPKLRVFIDHMAGEIRRRVEALDVPAADRTAKASAR